MPPAAAGRTRQPASSQSARRASTPAGGARSAAPRVAPPVLVRQVRGQVTESRHRGSIVQVGIDGGVLRAIGDPNVLVNLRSAVKPFGLVAFVEAGGIEAFDVTAEELAVMAGSHSGEDLHVRTLQGLFRRANLTQHFLGCGTDGAPLDALTAARLARDGERPGPVRHMCSGQHTSLLLLCRLNDWPLDDYWLPQHPLQRSYAATVARAFATSADRLVVSVDACGIPTYAFTLREVAHAFAVLADPDAVPASDPRSSMAPALLRIRDAMLAHPEMVAGNRDRLDTSLMKAAPGRLVAKGGAEGLRAFGLPGLSAGAAATPAGGAGSGGAGAAAGRVSGVAVKIEDGGGSDRATAVASVETLRQIGVLDAAALRTLTRYARPKSLDPRGRPIAEAVPEFELAPVGELLG